MNEPIHPARPKARHGLRSMAFGALSLVLWAGFALAVPAAVLQPENSAAGESDASSVQRFVANGPLPGRLAFSDMAGSELTALRAQTAKWGCGGWVFAPKSPGSTEPGSPLMAFAAADADYSGAPHGVARLEETLWPVLSLHNDVLGASDPLIGTAFLIGPFVQVASLAAMAFVIKHTERWPQKVFIHLQTSDAQVALKRVQCTIGSGSCRRYAGTYVANWWHDSNGPIKPVELNHRRLIVEDRCPWTRAGMLESYANKLHFMQWFHRWTNP
jgi:hypothetical protein